MTPGFVTITHKLASIYRKRSQSIFRVQFANYSVLALGGVHAVYGTMIIYIHYECSYDTTNLYRKAVLLKNVDYTSIYPHRIVYGNHVNVYGVGECRGAVFVLDRLEQINGFGKFVGAHSNDKYLGLQFGSSIETIDALRVVENVCLNLKPYTVFDN